ncbi:MAG TPA: elongation factor G [Gemmatimonadales bacterium]|nr:elongation factor G [Gemmatimonadales bacterium]HRZ09232.1 elongation factor G [Gemmatimonadales bacterium]
MRVYGSDAIRNVAFVGHGGSGKTTLVDALAFVSGASRRHGNIKDGTTLTDYTPDEIARQHSISLGLAYAEWMDTKLNLLDTPGYLDFFGEVVTGLHAADAAVVVVSGVSGVEVGTEKAWEVCDRLHLPRLIFVGQMDKEHANFERVFADVKAHLSPKVLPVEVPIGEGSTFRGIVNLFSGKSHIYKPGTKSGEYDEVEVPAEHRAEVKKYSDLLIETVAATDDALIERYLGGEEIPREEVIAALKTAVAAGSIVPLFVGSATLTFGMRALLTKMVEIFPAAADVPPPVDAPLLGRVFKTTSEPHVGDVTLFRLYAGTLKNGADVWNAEHEVAEKLNHLSVQQGRERTEVGVLHAGDIGSVAKLRDTHTGDTFCLRDTPLRLSPIPFPEAVASAAVVVKQRGEEDKLAAGLHKLHEEDPTFHFEYNSELRQTLIHGMGERHFEILLGRLTQKYGVHADLARPRIAYRETFKGKAEGQGKHKKQSGGRGQYGDCWIRIAPRPRGAGYEFVDKIVGGVIPNKYIPAVDRGIQESAERGVVAGYPVVDFQVECFDGSYHDVDSNEMSFKMAGILAFRTVAPKARPVLLEPLADLEVWTPEDVLGDVMGDLSARRGQILGTEADGRLTKVRAVVPESELYRYSTTLYSITHGRGTYRHGFHGYVEAPPDVAARVAEEHKEEQGH